MLIDVHDSRIRYVELMLEKTAAEGCPSYQLPEGFQFALFQPGDQDEWIGIEMSAEDIVNHSQGVEVFERYFGRNLDALEERMLFIVNSHGEKVATATAWWDIRHPGPSRMGMLHWVAVKKEWQGFGLAKPLVSQAVQLMASFGAERFVIPTQTTSWVACRVYLDLGFHPILQNLVHSCEGWKIIKRLTEHPALIDMESATLHEIFPNIFPWVMQEKQEHSCGSVVYGFGPDASARFLLVESVSGEWGFPKGHCESGETERETAVREADEECGIAVHLHSGFRRETVYMRGEIGKRSTYFLAEGNAADRPRVHDTDEVKQTGWYCAEEARNLLTTADRREVFEEALRYLHAHHMM